jgi:hypothetical protein
MSVILLVGIFLISVIWLLFTLLAFFLLFLIWALLIWLFLMILLILILWLVRHPYSRIEPRGHHAWGSWHFSWWKELGVHSMWGRWEHSIHRESIGHLLKWMMAWYGSCSCSWWRHEIVRTHWWEVGWCWENVTERRSWQGGSLLEHHWAWYWCYVVKPCRDWRKSKLTSANLRWGHPKHSTRRRHHLSWIWRQHWPISSHKFILPWEPSWKNLRWRKAKEMTSITRVNL